MIEEQIFHDANGVDRRHWAPIRRGNLVPHEPQKASPLTKSRMPPAIWALGFVSLFMDISSEMIHSLLPVFLVTVLGTSAATVGMIEGIGEATAAVAKLFSGWISDRVGKRKALAVFGYALAALSKPLFALAPTASWVLAARFSDRVGKGIRGAPRDALIGDLAPPGLRGAAYGLRQSLDTVGAFLGPLFAIGLMALFLNDFRLVFWVAIVPGLASVAILVLWVREPEAGRSTEAVRAPIHWREIGQIGRLYWLVVAIGFILTLARFSEAFLILRAENVGVPVALVPLVLVLMNLVYAATAYPMGAISDRADRKVVLAVGIAVLIVADLVLGYAASAVGVAIGAALWGLHMGLTQGMLAALVADTASDRLRGSAFGFFDLTSGVALLIASLVAGFLWELAGPRATFLAGAVFTLLALCGMAAFFWLKRNSPGARSVV